MLQSLTTVTAPTWSRFLVYFFLGPKQIHLLFYFLFLTIVLNYCFKLLFQTIVLFFRQPTVMPAVLSRILWQTQQIPLVSKKKG